MPLSAVAGLILVLVAFFGKGWPISGDVHTVDGEFAFVREEPHGASRVVARIAEGQEVLEIERHGNWLNVGVLGAGITGWIHLSFLEGPKDSRRRSRPLIPPMRRFRPAFDAFNDLDKKAGGKPFLSATHRENRVLWVRASPAWWSKPAAQRRSDLASLHQMWKVANEELPVTVVITDRAGKHRLEKGEE